MFDVLFRQVFGAGDDVVELLRLRRVWRRLGFGVWRRGVICAGQEVVVETL